MSLIVRPTDGLIHRLLQQNSQSAAKSVEAKPSDIRVDDQVNISRKARHHADAGTLPKTESRAHTQSNLESQLLRLYTHHSSSEEGK